MAQQKSFARAVYDGDIKGPDWKVVDEAGNEVQPGSQDFGHMRMGRSVRLRPDGSHISHVIDFQHPADTPVDMRDPDVDYGSPTTYILDRETPISERRVMAAVLGMPVNMLDSMGDIGAE